MVSSVSFTNFMRLVTFKIYLSVSYTANISITLSPLKPIYTKKKKEKYLVAFTKRCIEDFLMQRAFLLHSSLHTLSINIVQYN